MARMADETLEQNDPADTDLYYSLIFADTSRRAGGFALHALAAEIDAIPRSVSDPGIARVKLAWWHEELTRLDAGRPRHPLTCQLATATSAAAPDFATLLALPNAIETVLDWHSPPERGSLDTYLTQCHGSVWRQWAIISGDYNGATLDAATQLGQLSGAFLALRGLHADLKAEIYKLSAEALNEHEIDLETLRGQATNSALQPLFVQAVDQLRTSFEQTLSNLPKNMESGLLSQITLGRIMARTLDEIAASGSRLLTEQVSLTPLRKLFIAWRSRWGI